ncbi:MBL fold metallo-hydrolase [Promicromonospora panici]|uniref:MBL fold metallo-hydrolase n=1 Tax=Promicromonospora panici TaxID=2219658 RepID=UPI001F5CCE0F|nr:MBL fold metallo-hydrolase [Promicromonospora panici]
MTTPRTSKPVLSRRTLMTGAGTAALGVLGGVTGARAFGADPAGLAAPTATSPTPAPTGFATFAWLGTSGWKIRTPTTTVLLDPYVTRFDTGLAAGKFAATTRLRVDAAALDAALGAPGTPEGAVDSILVTHTHWDHFADVPHLARTRGATVFTTLTGYHLALALGVAQKQLAVVSGGEEMHLGDLVLRVVPSLHSRTATGALLFPGVRTQVPARPRTIADLPEGDTLSYLLRSPGGRSVLLLGGSDYDDRALQGLRVDTVALPVPSTDVTADYAGRLLGALGNPGQVVLVHWDDFESPLANPPRAGETTRVRMAALTEQIGRISPGTRVVLPEYGTPLDLL